MNKVPLSDEEAQRVVKLWRDTYARIPAMWRSADKGLAAIANGTEHSIGPTGLVRTTPTGLATPPGHFIRYAGLTQTQDGWTYTNRRQQKKIYGASMVENICQHLARNIIADQWVKAALWCSRNAPGWRVILQVHDEIVLCGPERDAPRVSDAVLKIMSASPDWWPDVPLAAESGIGDTYGAAH